MTSGKVTVIITTRNNREIIKECLDSVFGQTYKNISVIVSDDNSTDGTVNFIKKNFPRTKVIVNEKGEGPAQNRNLALLETDSPYVLFMDSDAVLDKNWIAKSVKIMVSDNKIGVLGGKIYNKDGTLQATASFFHLCGVSGTNIDFDIDGEEYLWWPSATMLARTALIKKINGFDGKYHYLYEDSDLGWRVNIAGYKVVYCNGFSSVHKFSATVKKELKERKIMFLNKRNKMITLLKNLELKSIFRYSWLIFGFCLIELIMLPYKIQMIKGNLAAILLIPHIIEQRRIISKYRKKHDCDLRQYLSFSLKDLYNIYANGIKKR